MKWACICLMVLGCGSNSLQGGTPLDASTADVKLLDTGRADGTPDPITVAFYQYLDVLCYSAMLCLQEPSGQTCEFAAMKQILDQGPVTNIAKEAYNSCLKQIDLKPGQPNCSGFDVNNPPSDCLSAFIH